MTATDEPWTPRWVSWKHNLEQIRFLLPARSSTVCTGDDWADTLLTVEHGSITVELASGHTTHIPTGGAFWLDGFDVAILHVVSPDPVQLCGVRRTNKVANQR